MNSNIYIYILIMAVITYLIRMLPLALFRKEIHNVYIKSFLHYVPYACLTAMTIPAIFYATESVISAVCSLAVATVLGLRGKSLPVVSAFAVLTVLVVEFILRLVA